MTPAKDPQAKDTQDGRWPVWKITVVLYPLGAGAMAVNFFFLGVLLQAIGMTVFSPWVSVGVGAVLGVPFTWLFARHIHKLIARAEREAD